MREYTWLGRIGTVSFLSLACLVTACDKKSGDGTHAQMKQAASRTVDVNDAALLASGEDDFGYCSACHGDQAEGRVGLAPSLASKSFLEAASDEFLIKTIADGREGTTMMGWKEEFDARQMQGLVAYIRSLRPTEPAALDARPLSGNAENGAEVFRTICANCHGNTGAGYQESGSGTGIGRKAFLDTVSDGYLRYIIKNGKSGTAMGAFAEKSRTAVANLKHAEIEDVIVYLRTNAW